MTEKRTIRQIAAELGVSKQAIRQRIDRNEELRRAYEEHSEVIDGVIYVDEQGVEIIRAVYSDKISANKGGNVAENTENTENTLDRNNAQTELIAVLQKTVDTLSEQVTVKDKQIAELSEMLKGSQAQINTLTDALTAAQALHAGTLQKALTERSGASDEVSEQEPKRRGFFARFRRG